MVEPRYTSRFSVTAASGIVYFNFAGDRHQQRPDGVGERRRAVVQVGDDVQVGTNVTFNVSASGGPPGGRWRRGAVAGWKRASDGYAGGGDFERFDAFDFTYQGSTGAGKASAVQVASAAMRTAAAAARRAEITAARWWWRRRWRRSQYFERGGGGGGDGGYGYYGNTGTGGGGSNGVNNSGSGSSGSGAVAAAVTATMAAAARSAADIVGRVRLPSGNVPAEMAAPVAPVGPVAIALRANAITGVGISGGGGAAARWWRWRRQFRAVAAGVAAVVQEAMDQRHIRSEPSLSRRRRRRGWWRRRVSGLGATGGVGGGGGGALELVAKGRITVGASTSFLAVGGTGSTGGNGLGSTQGPIDGYAGGDGLDDYYDGGGGGGGGGGGTGGIGGDGAGGAGGTIKLYATDISAGSASITTSGGAGIGTAPAGGQGRFIIGSNTQLTKSGNVVTGNGGQPNLGGVTDQTPEHFSGSTATNLLPADRRRRSTALPARRRLRHRFGAVSSSIDFDRFRARLRRRTVAFSR